MSKETERTFGDKWSPNKTQAKQQQPNDAGLTYGGHGTDAEDGGSGREAEMVQYCVGPCWVNHCDFTAGCRTRNNPNRTLSRAGRMHSVET